MKHISRVEFAKVWFHAIFCVETVCLLVFFASAILIANTVPLHIRPYPTTLDKKYYSPLFTQEFKVGVPNSALAFIIFSPFIFIPPVSFLKPDPIFPKFWLHSYIYTIGLTNILTISIKNYVGYFRPHAFFCNDDTFDTQCQDNFQNDFRHSFPSGHSSDSTMALLNISMALAYLCNHVNFKFNYTIIITKSIKLNFNFDFTPYVVFLCLIPFFIAIYVSVSRIHDNDHHPADVIAGILIGTTATAASFKLFKNINTIQNNQT